MVWKHRVIICWAHPIPISHWNGHIATVVSVDFSLVVRISEDACPSVHWSNFKQKCSTCILNHTGRMVCFFSTFYCFFSGWFLPRYMIFCWCGRVVSFNLNGSKLDPTTTWAVFRRTNSQVNTLHSCSFLCLAVSAASFAYRWVWPARAALAIPFLLSAAQGLKPDSPESLAVRLWEERVTQGLATSGINSRMKCHVVLSDVTNEKYWIAWM